MLNPCKEGEQRCVDCIYFFRPFPDMLINMLGYCTEQLEYGVTETALCSIDKFEPKDGSPDAKSV